RRGGGRRGRGRAHRAPAHPPAVRAAHRAGARHRRPLARVRRAVRGHVGLRPGVHLRARVAQGHDRPRGRARAQRPVRRDRGGRARARRDRAVPPAHALRARHPRGRREPVDGDRARHRRAQGVHARVRRRRRRRGPRRRARVAVLRVRLAAPRRVAPHLRVHRHRHRRARLADRSGRRVRARRGPAAVRELLPRLRRPHRRAPARARAPRPSHRPPREGSRMTTQTAPPAPATPADDAPRAERTVRRAPSGTIVRTVAGLALVVLLACLPLLAIHVPGVLPGPTYTPGALQMMALCWLIGALALSYHLLFGVAGLLSFGHALYFAAGVYGLAIVLDTTEIPLLPAAALVLVGGIVLAHVVGAISLRVTGISFAMVTLAFAQAGNVLVRRNPGGATGGEEGLAL